MKIGNLTFSVLSMACAGVMAYGSPSFAKDYPDKQIEIVVPYAAGGGTDLLARAFADTAKKYASQPFGVINKTGGAGAIGFSEIARSRPNGYKIGTGTVELAMLPHMGLANFTTKDFTPIARLNAEPSAITVKIDAPWNTYQEFMDYVKENPTKVRVGNSGTGAIWHIAAAALEEKTGAKLSHIPYDGGNPAVTALLGGHIEAVTVSSQEVSSQVDGGQLKMLAVMADERLAKYPDVPTLKELGVDLTVATWRGIVAPKNIPEDVTKKLREISKQTVEDPAFQETLNKMNLTSAYLDADEFAAAIEKDDAFFAETMKRLGIGQ